MATTTCHNSIQFTLPLFDEEVAASQAAPGVETATSVAGANLHVEAIGAAGGMDEVTIVSGKLDRDSENAFLQNLLATKRHSMAEGEAEYLAKRRAKREDELSQLHQLLRRLGAK